MHPVTCAVATSTVMAALLGAFRTWAWQRAARSAAREKARCDHVHHLPSGSRIADLGRRGVVIEIGRQDDGASR
jgi:hypothetical protein